MHELSDELVINGSPSEVQGADSSVVELTCRFVGSVQTITWQKESGQSYVDVSF